MRQGAEQTQNEDDLLYLEAGRRNLVAQQMVLRGAPPRLILGGSTQNAPLALFDHRGMPMYRPDLRPATPPLVTQPTMRNNTDSYCCIAGSCLVWMSNGQQRHLSTIIKGGKIRGFNHAEATVECVVRTVGFEENIQFSHLEDGLLITGGQPIRRTHNDHDYTMEEDLWTLPRHIVTPTPPACEGLYTLVLQGSVAFQ
eukprot:16444675-Heterocapsa_arctica.AAC.1